MGMIAKRRSAAENQKIAATKSILTVMGRAEVVAALDIECRIANYKADARLEATKNSGGRLQKWAAPETARADQYHVEDRGDTVLLAFGASPERLLNPSKRQTFQGPWLAQIAYTPGADGAPNKVESTLLRWYTNQNDGSMTNRGWYTSLVEHLFERISHKDDGTGVPQPALAETRNLPMDPDTEACLLSVRAHERANHDDQALDPRVLVLSATEVIHDSERWSGPVPVMLADSVLATSRQRRGTRTTIELRRFSFASVRSDGSACVFDLKRGDLIKLSFSRNEDRDAVLAWARGARVEASE